MCTRVHAGPGIPPRAQLSGAVRVRLTDPEGFLVSNHVISDVFAALSALD